MIKNFPYFVLLLCCLQGTAFAQKCYTNQLRQKHLAMDASRALEIERIHAFTEQWIQNNQNLSRSVVTLPVVVHVVYANSTQNISNAQVSSQIDVLNADFRKINANFAQTVSGFQSIAADSEIEFCLAQLDPLGNPSNGITRSQTSITEIGLTSSLQSAVLGGQDSWDASRYINIWVCEIGGDILGYATPPGTAPANKDGLVIDYRYFGTVGTASNQDPNHLGRTAVHEMGHYFNLEHVWGPDLGGCLEDDFVGDTPPQNGPTDGCFTGTITDACSFGGKGINYNNFMDYTDDACMTMFTSGQKNRMLAALNGPRAGLLNNSLCAPPSAGIQLEKKSLKLYPNPAKEILNLQVLGMEQYKIINSLGQTILPAFEVNQSKQLDVSAFAPGVYYIVHSSNPFIQQKLIVTK